MAHYVFKNSERGLIEVAPLAYMRGRTLDNAFIILDEAQNTTPAPKVFGLMGFPCKVWQITSRSISSTPSVLSSMANERR